MKVGELFRKRRSIPDWVQGLWVLAIVALDFLAGLYADDGRWGVALAILAVFLTSVFVAIVWESRPRRVR